MMSWYSCLCLLSMFHSASQSLSSPFSPSHRPRCHSSESAALIQFRKSFSIENYNDSSSDCDYYFGISNPNTTLSWDSTTDCCTWSGVECDEFTARVVGLHLKCGGLRGVINSNSSLFHLGRLRSLILSRNNFEGSGISPLFGKFHDMIHLDLSSSKLNGQVPQELAHLSNLITLDLHQNLDLIVETSCLRRIVRNLTSLEELVLSYVNLSHVLPSSFMNLSTSLRYLDLRRSSLSGEFPENIFNLENLEVLRLSYNENLNGSFPKFNRTILLSYLGLSFTGFVIDLRYLTRNLKHLKALYLSNCNFIGSNFPKMLGNFSQITALDMASNNFGGQIPWYAFNLEKFTYLDLSDNNFEGQFPEICRNSTRKNFLCDPTTNQLVGPLPMNLKSLLISYNLLSGTIASWIYGLGSLQDLSISHNQFTGQIKEFQFNSLVNLQLGSNKLHGLIPTSIFQQVNLSLLDLSSNNLTGFLAFEQFTELKNLQILDLSFNDLSLVSSNITKSYAFSNALRILVLSSCNLTEFPYSIRNAVYLEILDISNNQIKGNLPQWISNVGTGSLYLLNISHNLLTHLDRTLPWKNLLFIDLQSNQLKGHLLNPPPSTIFISMANNQLFGEISSSICDLSSIEVLDLSNNSLSGSILSCLGNFSNTLSVLDLRMNNFTGAFPESFAKGNSLRTLNLNGNKLEGSLPRLLLNCEKLEIFDIGNNQINGSFPFLLESLPELQVLILRSNRFRGNISSPKTRFPFRKLRILDLSNNGFTGHLPDKYFESFVAMTNARTGGLEYMGKLTLGGKYYQDSVTVVIKGFYTDLVKIQKMFITIDFSRNKFSGEIPRLIGKLHSLKGLNFSHNRLTGAIPTSLGNLSNLEWLDLSANQLVGNIPWQLASYLNQLQVLNLSSNKLEGPIPRGPQFDTFEENSFSENSGLCGFPLPKSCGGDTVPKQEGEHEEYDNAGISIDPMAMRMGFGSGLVIGISIGYMIFFSSRFDVWLKKRSRS